jgi:hypothetical protein
MTRVSQCPVSLRAENPVHAERLTWPLLLQTSTEDSKHTRTCSNSETAESKVCCTFEDNANITQWSTKSVIFL